MEVWNWHELYEQVWQKPLIKIAPQYNISNVMLGKICRKLRIPLPCRGYWARKAAGHSSCSRRIGPRNILLSGKSLDGGKRLQARSRVDRKFYTEILSNPEVQTDCPHELRHHVCVGRKQTEGPTVWRRGGFSLASLQRMPRITKI